MINRSALIRMVTALVNELPAGDSPFNQQLCLEYGGVLVVIRPTSGHTVASPGEALPRPDKKAPRPKRPSELKAQPSAPAPRPNGAAKAKADKAPAAKQEPAS